MALQPHSSALATVAVVALIVWRLRARFRRMVGRQRLSAVRPWITIVVFPLLIVLLSFGALSSLPVTLALFGGLSLGTALGVYGLRLTKFEVTPTGLYYTPNTHLGIALSALFAGRLLYRAATLYMAAGNWDPQTTSFARSPLTLAIFATLAGYYVSYAIGLLRWRARSAIVSG